MKPVVASRTTRLLVVIGILLAELSCASKPVEVTTEAIVTLDTARRSAATARKPAPAKNFWGAMTSLDPDYVTTHPVSSDERQFAGALRLMMAGDADDAELLLDSLARHAKDSTVRSASHILLTAALQYQDKWKELAEISTTSTHKEDSAEINRASVELWASAFKDVPRRKLEFPAGPVVLRLTLSAAGTPMVQVVINGKAKQFWLDTGSSMSIVSSDVALECEVAPLVQDTLEVATTTGRVAARPAAIRMLDIGGLLISNSTAMIVASELMAIQAGEPENPGTPFKIDGIIGFDIISQLNVQVDYAKGQVRLSRPVKSAAGRLDRRNLFWVGTPVVRLISERGIPLHLGLDTGAQETFATERMLEKIRVRTFIGERKRVGGFGGLKEFRGRFIANLRLAIRGRNVIFQKLLVFVPAVSSFVAVDGVLGSDIGKTGVMQIDALNGIFSVEASLVGRRAAMPLRASDLDYYLTGWRKIR